jgi:hypothetical protein
LGFWRRHPVFLWLSGCRFLTRWSRLAQFTIAPCLFSKLALVLNVNAPVILKSSMNDPVLRDRVVAQVEEITKHYEQVQASGEGWDQEVAPQKSWADRSGKIQRSRIDRGDPALARWSPGGRDAHRRAWLSVLV